MKNGLPRREVVFILFTVTAAAIMAAAFIAMNAVAAAKLTAGGDFLLTWKGARALFAERADPYSGEVANFVQRQVFGREAQPGEKPYIPDLPMPLLVLYYPLGLIGSPVTARAIYLFISEVSLLGLLLVSLSLADWRPRRLYRIVFFPLMAAGFYSLWSLMEGSPAVLLGFIYAAILLSLRGGADELAGFLIALSFQSWEAGGAFLLLIFFWVVAQRRWGVFTGLFMSLFVLFVVSYFVYPEWIEPFLRANLADAQWVYGFSLSTVLGRIWPEYGSQVGLGISAALWFLLLVEWLSARRGEFRRLFWTACLTLSASPLLGWRGELQNLVILLIPLTFILAVVRERWKAGYWLSGLLMAMVFAVPWVVLFAGFLPAHFQPDALFLWLPVFCLTGMYWIRWWALRPARTWLERASINEYR